MSIEQTAENMTISTLPLPGDVLRQQREKLGLSQKDIADRLRLRLAVIQNIEENNFKSDQVATFTRGYLRSYAKAVGLSDDEVLPLLEGALEDEHKEHAMQSFSRKTNREKHDSRIMLITWGVLVVLVGISSVWWWQNQSQDTLSVSELVSSQGSLSQESEADLAVLEAQRELNVVSTQPLQREASSQTEPDSQTQPDASSIEATTENTSTEATPVDNSSTVSDPEPEVAVVENEPAQKPEAPSQSETPVTSNQVSMSFSADCWIQVKDADGKVLATGVKKAGHQLTLSGQAPYSVILGAPEGVTMTFAGEAVDLSGYTAGKVARFKLP
ncbi:conserved hypothetical protein [Vibrio nigripulchritudo SOn1]|uniref:HTH cro/C1-type domain-containing protein n=1 Tax=Vibrio nigripulchritudo SOn1 TaxID=1238450 RepID=A0AAV2VWT5_9VIBR|nr:cytoskeleton protein RodZ [Vibrio nigripulchritudo]CCO49097.1 conserved hypothetical protein [Vibrio nigripulchritudo SOn1]